jgi:hypothetical protein
MQNFVRLALTGPDNRTWDIARVLWAVGGLAYLLAALWNVFGLHNAPDLMAFGNGFGVVLAAGGAGVGLKGHTEPKSPAMSGSSL